MHILKMDLLINIFAEYINDQLLNKKHILSKEVNNSLKGSISIEASLIFPITLVILMLFITLVIALHDSVCILGATNSGMDSIILEKEGINYEKRIMDGLYYQDKNDEFLYNKINEWFEKRKEYKNLLTSIGGNSIIAANREYIFFEKHSVNIARRINLEILGEGTIGEDIERVYFNPADTVRTIEFVAQKASFKKLFEKFEKQEPGVNKN